MSYIFISYVFLTAIFIYWIRKVQIFDYADLLVMCLLWALAPISSLFILFVWISEWFERGHVQEFFTKKRDNPFYKGE